MKTFGNTVIYENLREIIDPKHTVLVVWDVFTILADRIFNKDDFTANLKQLIKAARNNLIPIVHVRPVLLPYNIESSWRLYKYMRDAGVSHPDELPPWLHPGASAEYVTELSPQDNDIIIDKPTGSIFIATPFEYMMRNRGVNTFIFTGISTEVGVDSCARDSSNRGFYTVVAADCVSSPNKEMHESTLKVLERLCIVVPYKDIVKQWNKITQ